MISIRRTALVVQLVLALIVSSVTLGSGQSLGLPNSQFLGPTEYNAGMQNLEIEQDNRGFIYFANNFGLLEFDGSTWQNYTVKEGSKVRSIEITNEGLIYVAAQGEFGFFEPDNLGILTYHSLSARLPEEHRALDEVWKVFVGKKEVYFCTFTKIFTYYNNELIDVLPIPSTEDFFFPNKRLYAQTNDYGLQRLINGNLKPVLSLTMKNNEEIIAILLQGDRKQIYISNKGVFYDKSGNKQNSLQDISGIETLRVSTAIKLNNGNIAVGTEQSGLWIINENGQLQAHLSKGKGLATSTITALYEDLDGNLWVSHNSGLSLIELSSPFTYINEDIGFPGSGYDAYMTNNTVYLASNYGLYTSKTAPGMLDFREVAHTSGQTYSINEEGGRIYIGHHNGGYYLENGAAKLATNRTGTWLVLSIPGSINKLLAGTYTGLDLYLLDEAKKPKSVKHLAGFDESSRVMEFDDDGALWMTHGYKGVYRISFNESHTEIVNVAYFGQESGLPGSELVNVFKLENELVFTTVKGVYRFDKNSDTFYRDSLRFGFPELDQPINLMTSDGNGNIYYLARNNMGVLKKATSGRYEVETGIFNKIFGLINDDLSNISLLNSQNVLFGGKQGFAVYNPTKSIESKLNHRAFIREVRITTSDSLLYAGGERAGESVANDEPISYPTISYANNSLQFVFTSNFLNDYKSTQYTYFLEGFDDDWTEWNTKTEVRYTNLFEGTYTFKVKAKDIYSRESKESIFTFTISPPWFRSTVAYTGYVVLLMGSIVFAMAVVDRRHRKSRLSFEKQKQREVDEIGNQLETLTQTTSEEISRLEAEKLEAEVQRKNTELAASTMNLINKNKFISHIKENLNSIKKKSKTDVVKKELTTIMKNIDKNISHDDDWKQFTFHFNNVHGDFISRITSEFDNLSSQDIRLCSYLRLNLSTKEIAELLNISVRGVEISRYRLRKKLRLERSQNLADFILSY